MNDDVVYWRVAVGQNPHKRRRRGRKRWVVDGWLYSTASSFTVPGTTLARGAVEETANQLKLNFTASGVGAVRVWVSDDPDFPLSYRRRRRWVHTNTQLFVPKDGESFVTITGASLAALRALTSTDVIWKVTATEMGTNTEMTTTAAQVWTAVAVADAGSDQANVGYSQLVTLDGSGSTPSASGAPLAYAWTQTGGMAVTLTGASTVAPTFTSHSAQDVLDTPDKARHGIVDLNREDDHVTFQLAITDQNAQTDTDTIVVYLGEGTSGLANVPLNQPVTLNAPEQGGVYDWSVLSVPTGSVITSTAIADVRNPSFTPDVVGAYVIGEAGAGTAVSLTVNAATYSGVDNNCAFCHQGGLTGVDDKVTPWSATGHSDMLVRGLNGTLSSHYGSSCIKCHTLGYDPYHSNGGFDDVATQEGWTFPHPAAGVYDAQSAGIKNMANIQCENCHGPGSQHFGKHDAAQIVSSFNVGVCAICHDSGSHHYRPREWRYSGHSSTPARSSGSCAACHTAQGFAQSMAGEAVTTPSSPEPQTCAACHDPHDVTNTHQLRKIGDVTFPNGEIAASPGVASVCYECHKGRRDTTDAAQMFADLRAPHHNVQAAIFEGFNAFEINGPYSNSPHSAYVTTKCVYCHMADGPAHGEAGEHEVGSHSFNVTHNGVENFANACNTTGCHVGNPVTSYDRQAFGNFDGLNGAQGVQTEIHGLIGVLRDEINSQLTTSAQLTVPGQIVEMSDSHGRIHAFIAGTEDDSAAVWTEAQFQAAYNLFLVEFDGSYGIHNTRYVVRLLQQSYKNITGNDVPGATVFY